jgi:hypothetical protein
VKDLTVTVFLILGVHMADAVRVSPCQARLAALARDITGWEDDLSHPVVKYVMLGISLDSICDCCSLTIFISLIMY